jgi:hypothetical protein
LDVDAASVKMDVEPGTGRYRKGTITFKVREGKALDLAGLHASLKDTRLSGKTRSAVISFDVTAKGEVTVSGKETLLKVSGPGQQFALAEDPKAKPSKGAPSPYQRLRAALAKGARVTGVTGRVQGWSGPWPEVLRAPPGGPEKRAGKKPPLLIVTDFQTAKE